ncbi:MAG: hypothetical protein AAGG44_21600, partial [Planctomycetota bacterium]
QNFSFASQRSRRSLLHLKFREAADTFGHRYPVLEKIFDFAIFRGVELPSQIDPMRMKKFWNYGIYGVSHFQKSRSVLKLSFARLIPLVPAANA